MRHSICCQPDAGCPAPGWREQGGNPLAGGKVPCEGQPQSVEGDKQMQRPKSAKAAIPQYSPEALAAGAAAHRIAKV